MITYLTRVLPTTLALSSVSGSILAAGGGGKFPNPDFTQGDTIPALMFADVPIGALTPYESWFSSKNLSGHAAAADKDPDFDGVKNVLEFVRGGEPNPVTHGSNSVALLPTPTRNLAGDFIFTFRRKIASVGGVSLSFRWSGNLTFQVLNTVPIGATSSTRWMVSPSPLPTSMPPQKQSSSPCQQREPQAASYLDGLRPLRSKAFWGFTERIHEISIILGEHAFFKISSTSLISG